MLKALTAAMLVLAGWAALEPRPMSWVFIAAAGAFELWLAERMRSLGRAPVAVDEAPYRFTAEEAALVSRYRFYFTWPVRAAQAGSVLAAIGLAGAVLGLWLTFRQAFVEGALIGANLFAVAWFTRRLTPAHTLRLAAARGNREALRMLELMDPVWDKIRAGNAV